MKETNTKNKKQRMKDDNKEQKDEKLRLVLELKVKETEEKLIILNQRRLYKRDKNVKRRTE